MYVYIFSSSLYTLHFPSIFLFDMLVMCRGHNPMLVFVCISVYVCVWGWGGGGVGHNPMLVCVYVCVCVCVCE